jgi:DNA modification methylase
VDRTDTAQVAAPPAAAPAAGHPATPAAGVLAVPPVDVPTHPMVALAAAQGLAEAKPGRGGSGGRALKPKHSIASPELRIYTGDCRGILRGLNGSGLAGTVDLVFADPPFNWNRAYDKWDDSMPREDYLRFTEEWLDLCIEALRPGGAFWVNIPDDTAAEIVVHLKKRGLWMENWCVWHYRFGQNTKERFISSKVHSLYFLKPTGAGAREQRTFNVREILEPSDRATTYFDPRTQTKRDGMPPGMRLPMDVWYGPYWGRIQGNNKERRANHDNQLPEVYLERVVRACSNEGDLVMDPFLGSGTTGVMAHALKRRFIGTEFSAANAKSAFARIKAGPTRPLGTTLGQSTAIHPPRRVGAKTRERLGGTAGPKT